MSYILELALLFLALAAELGGHPRLANGSWFLLLTRLWLRVERERRAKQRALDAIQRVMEMCNAWVER